MQYRKPFMWAAHYNLLYLPVRLGLSRGWRINKIEFVDKYKGRLLQIETLVE